MFYVNITDVEDSTLEFYGFRFVYEDATNKIYEDYSGDEYIVPKNGKQFIRVDDVNTAAGIGSMGFEFNRP